MGAQARKSSLLQAEASSIKRRFSAKNPTKQTYLKHQSHQRRDAAASWPPRPGSPLALPTGRSPFLSP